MIPRAILRAAENLFSESRPSALFSCCRPSAIRISLTLLGISKLSNRSTCAATFFDGAVISCRTRWAPLISPLSNRSLAFASSASAYFSPIFDLAAVRASLSLRGPARKRSMSFSASFTRFALRRSLTRAMTSRSCSLCWLRRRRDIRDSSRSASLLSSGYFAFTPSARSLAASMPPALASSSARLRSSRP